MKLFDQYDARARLSVAIILVSPAMLSLYILFEVFQNIATTTLVALAMYGLANLYIVHIRIRGAAAFDKRNMVAEYLFKDNSPIEIHTRLRLLKHLASVDNCFEQLYDDNDMRQYQESYIPLYTSALSWLKEKTRDSELVSKENAFYGFCRNMYACKWTGVAISALGALTHIVYLTHAHFNKVPYQIDVTLSLGIYIFYLIVWIFAVRKKLVLFSAGKYAEGLIRAFERSNME